VQDKVVIFCSMVFGVGLINGDLCPRLTPIEPRYHGSKIWDKIRYNSACVRDFREIFARIGGLRGWAIECRQYDK